MTVKREVQILLIEDDPGHARLIEKNLRRAGVVNDIIKIDDGGEAIEYIFDKNLPPDPNEKKPKLVLLDLNLPTLNGYQILEKMKSDPHTRKIPVIILTTTDDPREIQMCYELGCNIYLTKPVDYERFSDSIKRLGMFIQIVQIPNGIE